MEPFLGLAQFINDQLQSLGLSVHQIYGEIIASAVVFILFLILGWIVYHVFSHYFSRWAKKTKTMLDDEIIKNVKKPIYFFVILLGLYYAVDQLAVLDIYAAIIRQVFLAAEILLAGFIITRIINVFITW
ncbi:MAG: hypothetical protein V1726_03470 [Methanobacteriota archaeon]